MRCRIEFYCVAMSLTDTKLSSVCVCLLRLQTPTPSSVNHRKRNLPWKTTWQRPSPALSVEGPVAGAEESRHRRALRRSPAMSRWGTGPGPHVRWLSPTLRTPPLTPTGNVSRQEPITAQLGVTPH